MPDRELEVPKTFVRLGLQQLQVYAKELQQHFQNERRLREEVLEKNRQLEQRVQEITALNRLFQQHLCQSTTIIEAYRKFVARLRILSEEANAMETRNDDSASLPECPLHPRGHQ